MSAVQPRHQDRLACPQCGGLLERIGGTTDDGVWYNAPVAYPTNRLRVRLTSSDIRTIVVSTGGSRFAEDVTADVALLAYFCSGCNTDFAASHTRPFHGELPDWAYYDPDERADIRTATRPAIERVVSRLEDM